jgi:hypothetical protein
MANGITVLARDHAAMTRTSSSAKVLLLAERPQSEANSSGAPLRRFRIARWDFDSAPSARQPQLAQVPATEV